MDLSNAPSALAGGALIGLSTVLLLALNGRIAGNSGILARCWPSPQEGSWRLHYLGGLVLGGLLHQLLAAPAPLTFPPSWVTLGLAGVLVGFGTRMGSGCTSGHGICGLSRLSTRSLVATCVFMATGMLTVWLVRRAGQVWW